MAPGRSIVAGQPARMRASSIATLSCAGLPPGYGPTRRRASSRKGIGSTLIASIPPPSATPESTPCW